MKTALIVGATGLIGKHLLDILLADSDYTRIKAVTRKALEQTHPKLENIIINFDTISATGDKLKADDVFCCLGTTMKQAGSKAAFRKVDLEYPHEIAKITRQLGAKRYLLISALGADANSSIYYNQIKGETEALIRNPGFETIHIFRPSLLLGNRAESRPGEDSAKLLYKYLGWIIPKRYKGIEAEKVARAMNHFAKDQRPGVFVHESLALQQF